MILENHKSLVFGLHLKSLVMAFSPCICTQTRMKDHKLCTIEVDILKPALGKTPATKLFIILTTIRKQATTHVTSSQEPPRTGQKARLDTDIFIGDM